MKEIVAAKPDAKKNQSYLSINKNACENNHWICSKCVSTFVLINIISSMGMEVKQKHIYRETN